jgi:molecular chaperone DnaJ
MHKDYYKSLVIEKGASKDEIKKAFYKLAHKYHPDKKGGDEKKFKEVNEAYQILSDDQKRSQYDQYGRVFEGGGPQGGGQGFGGFEGFNPQDFQGFDFGNMGDIFGDFFGGQGGGERVKRGRDISIEITVSFHEAIFGTERKILITKNATCSTCSGTGAKPETKQKKCTTCNGQGKLHETKKSFLGVFTSVRECDACGGLGTIPEEKCATCHGHGTLRKQEEIVIRVPAGIQSGEMIRMTGMGEAMAHGVTGDLYVKIGVIPDPVFSREGHNLIMTLPIKLSEALLGAEHSIKTLDGMITVKIPEGVSIGEILRVKGKGVPVAPNRRGDLLIKLEIKLPNKLSKKGKEIVEELKKEGM